MNDIKSLKTILKGANGMQAPVPAGVGGKPTGSTHAQGGMNVVDNNTGEVKAEIEGDERIFSQEDTAVLEEQAMQIMQLQEQGDTQNADALATTLGYAVVEMIVKQEQSMAQQEEEMASQGMMPASPDDIDMAYADIPEGGYDMKMKYKNGGSFSKVKSMIKSKMTKK